MHVKKNILTLLGIILSCLLIASVRASTPTIPQFEPQSLTEIAIAKELGWINEDNNRCSGYYHEEAFIYPQNSTNNKDVIQITSNEGLLFSQRGTSVSEGHITISRQNQQITANKAYLYRDPATGKLNAIDLISNVVLREPNDLVIAQSAHYEPKTNSKLLRGIYYRTAIYANPEKKPAVLTRAEITQPRNVTQLSAWGRAKEFKQDEPNIFVLEDATYSTCPPLSNTWRVKASHIELNKESGRGYAKNARIYVKGIPIIYTPYINFPIDSRRETGFLWPTFGTSSKYGASVSTPFYWNLAPNYDMTTTPAILGKRGVELTNLFRYLTPTTSGNLTVAVLPNDRMFHAFQEMQQTALGGSTDPTTIAELRRLENASTTRNSLSWQNYTRYNEHWNSDVDFNYVSDDYYLRNLSPNYNEVTQNQLLQQAELNYKGQNWTFLSRIQGYQTLHPVDEATIENQYIRLPQFALEGDYPDSMFGLNYFISNDLTRFDIRSMPGDLNKLPIGDRFNIQPGISRTFHLPYFYFDPRLQYAYTQYQVTHVENGFSKSPARELPIFDISTGFYFDRNITVFNNSFVQTLEPQFYYTYVPYRNQDQLPIFDTTVNTLTYDQLFAYNRFSGLDRIGDANQLSVGVTTRFIDQQSGFEKIRLGVGQILYFKNRLVTLCNDATCSNVTMCTGSSCTDYPDNPSNTNTRSPIAGVLTYNLNRNWSATADTIWNAKANQFNNQSLALHFQPQGTQKIINIGYNFVRQGDILPGDNPNSGASNLSQTDFSFSWPVMRDWSMVGRWTQNWNHRHFQNLLYGLQYDSCCWAVRFVTGRSFINLTSNNTYQYDTKFFIQFALKGLGNIGSRDPTQTLSTSINGYQSNFGRDF